MKILLIPFLLLTLNVFGQKTKAKQPVAKTTKESAVTKFEKRLVDDSSYGLSGSVKVANGKEEKVAVNFRATVPIDVWKQLVVKSKMIEKEFFVLVAALLTLNAQYTLKNTLSFEPFPNQFFFYNKDEKVFISSYKMSGRNGYGNLVETSELVRYDPESDFK